MPRANKPPASDPAGAGASAAEASGAEPRTAPDVAVPPAASQPAAPPRRAHPAGLIKTGELIDRSGVSRQVVYTYLTMGLLAEAATTASGQKLFAPKAVDCIQLVQRLNDEGFTLRDIQQIFGAQLAALCKAPEGDDG